MSPGMKVILFGWLPFAMFVIFLLVMLYKAEKSVQERRKGVPIEWK